MSRKDNDGQNRSKEEEGSSPKAERRFHEAGHAERRPRGRGRIQGIPRTEVTKKLWAYIKKNGLQDPKNKRMIKADAALKAVFGGRATVNMFEMTKLVSKHLK